MSFASDIKRRYGNNGINTSEVGVRLTYKSKTKSPKTQKPDIKGHVQRLINAEKPKFAQELSQFAHHITLKHKRTNAVIEGKLKKELYEAESTQNLRLVRMGKKLGQESQRRYEELISQQELIIAKIASTAMPEQEPETGYIQPRERNAKVKDVDKIVGKRLDELTEQLTVQISSTAKQEAEKAVKRAREEDNYMRLRGGR